jgi:hypothetical protein
MDGLVKPGHDSPQKNFLVKPGHDSPQKKFPVKPGNDSGLLGQ